MLGPVLWHWAPAGMGIWGSGGYSLLASDGPILPDIYPLSSGSYPASTRMGYPTLPLSRKGLPIPGQGPYLPLPRGGTISCPVLVRVIPGRPCPYLDPVPDMTPGTNLGKSPKIFLECAKVLFAHHAPVKVKNKNGWTPMHEAISYGDRPTSTFLNFLSRTQQEKMLVFHFQLRMSSEN